MKRVIIFLLIAGGVAYLIGQNTHRVESPDTKLEAKTKTEVKQAPKKEQKHERQPENAKQEYVSATIDRVNSYNEAIGK